MENIKERYQASMVLHGVGDAMGFVLRIFLEEKIYIILIFNIN